jgi:4-alpha-glucanotransferase
MIKKYYSFIVSLYLCTIILRSSVAMRESGILMHITSLPGPYGVGTMGKQAFAFVDFLEEAGQRCWQILPLSPTGYGDSPYQSCSAYAGNYYLIDLDTLICEGLLEKEEVSSIDWADQPDRVDYGRLYSNRLNVLRIACGRFEDGADFE